MNKPNEKQRIVDNLVKHGANPAEAQQMVDAQYAYVAEVYKDAPVSKKAEVIATIAQ